ncbi:MAG: DNA polymerase Y family protein [Bacteriovoracaceae bacterium]
MSSLNRKVFYLNVSAFPIEIERVMDSSLKSRPVVMAPLHSDRSLIWEVSQEAKEEGIERGMSLANAMKICPQCRVIAPRPDLVNQVNRKIEERLLSKMTPLYEIENPGHAYLDLTGFENIYGQEGDIGVKILKSIQSDFSLNPTVGSAANKLVSKVAAKSKINELICVQRGTEQDFLSPLPVEALPFVREMINKKGENLFEDLNLIKIADLLKLSPYALEVAFGKSSSLMANMARGIDYSPVIAPMREKCIYEETFLKEDSNDLTYLKKVLLTLMESGLYKLRKQGLFCSKIGLSIRYIDYKFVTKQKSLKFPIQYCYDVEPVLMKLFHNLLKRRVRVQFLSLCFKDLIQSEVQLSLFDQKEQKQEVVKVVDDIKQKYGQSFIRLGKEVG